jgi:hypothetical protein
MSSRENITRQGLVDLSCMNTFSSSSRIKEEVIYEQCAALASSFCTYVSFVKISGNIDLLKAMHI